MTTKQAIRLCKAFCIGFVSVGNDLNERIKDAAFYSNLMFDIVQKQFPKKPNINIIYDTYDCPNCQRRYEMTFAKYNYCPHCGQCLEWGE